MLAKMYLTANPSLRFLYVFWGFLECIGFGGIIYGWGSLVYILKEEGIYSDLCFPKSDNETIIATASSNLSFSINISSNDPEVRSSDEELCHAQNSRLELVFTLASATLGIGSFVIGQINFYFGTRVSRIVATLIYIGGAFLIAFTSKEMPWLVFPGLAFLGFGGISFIMTNLQIANLFSVGGSAVIGLLCGAFDSSAGVQVMIKLGYENGISRQVSYIIIGSTCALTFVHTFLFLPKDFIHKPKPPSMSQQIFTIKSESGGISEKVETKQRRNKEKPDSESGSVKNLVKYVVSPTYFLHVFWLAVLQLRFYFFLGSVNSKLENLLHSKNDVSYYTDILLYIMMGGLVASPCAGYFYELQYKIFKGASISYHQHLMPAVIPLALTTTLCAAMSGLILMDSAEVLYAVFILLLFFRSFMYTMAAGYITAIFPSAYFGGLYGVQIIVAGIISLLQYALYSWSAQRGSKEVDIFMLILTFVTLIHPLYQWWDSRRVQRGKM